MIDKSICHPFEGVHLFNGLCHCFNSKDKPINELDNLSDEDKRERIRQRIIEMLELQGKLNEALYWLAKDLTARQRGEDK